MQSIRFVVQILRWSDYLCRIFKLIFFLAPIEFFYRLTKCSSANEIWIFGERPDEARDNAYELFRYVTKIHSEINAVYAIKKGSEDFRKVSIIGKYVEHGSFGHYCLYAKSKVAISTDVFGASPIGASTKYMSWISPRRCIVFVDHGIEKDHYSTWSKKSTRVDLKTCAASAEYEYIRKFGGYASYEISLVGLARFDRLALAKTNKSKILFFPTFRKYLYNLTRLNYKTAAVLFRESNYYQAIQEVLGDRKLEAILRSNNVELVFFLHPSVQPFRELFYSNSDRITIAAREKEDLQQIVSDCSLLITDYSSIFFDFAYMSRPVIYYQFDYNEYRESHYREGYFDYLKDGFGPVVRDCSSLVVALEKYLLREMKPEPDYIEKRNRFFLPYERGNCERIMEAILSHPKVCSE